ncbi:uncharacterized protein LOC110023150 [Phalaenopsis equestris]|uniref:uncharacterized protein LOC110023150 n=1 Tax=Phalaenopsis equestris TaxID=78828 RepID=UPI0009E30CFE|nr:uncharacterized protein LOC110023150 [Phalaenopsis equestris]
MEPEVGLLRGIGGASFPESCSEETSVDGGDEEGDYLENNGTGPLSISTSATGRVCETNRRIYSRSEMEDLRFLDIDAQRRMWNAVYAGMESDVAREYSKLWVPDDQKKGNHENLVWDKLVRKKDDFGAVGEVFSLNMMESGIFFSSYNAYGETLVGSENYTINEVSFCDENNVVEFEIDDVDDDDSDDEYESIQRPAFLVEGEPDFDSGPPLDGLEYLRRVRWEAAHIPKVKVAELNLTKVCGEQTPYMPVIAGIKECPLNLLPSKHWEDGFLADFSKLRQAFSEFENSRTTNESPKPSACRQVPRGDPTLTAILAMDASSRASILRSSISSFEASSTISRTDCLWLFALSATVDAPLNVDTCASMRCLLRKCSSLLAAKSRVDDEVSMLSILIAIAGKYFGQSEKR